MAGALVKSSGAEGNQQFYTTQEEWTKQFWREIRGILKKDFPEAFIVSEWSYPTSALDGCFHSDFFHWFQGYNDLFQKESWRILNGYSEGHSYFDEEGKGDITFFLSKFMEQYERTKGKGYISLPLGNHDNARLGNKRSNYDLEIIYAFGLTMPGVTFLYYGNEIGMRQMPESWPQVEGAYRPRNGARTPMQWTQGKNLGFSTASAEKLYLPIDPADDAPTVEANENNPSSLLHRTRKLIQLKHTEPALAAYAEFVPLYAKKNTYPFIYARAKDKDAVIVILNPSGKESSAEFNLNIPFSKLILLAGNEVKVTKNFTKISVIVPKQTYAIYKLDQ
jgi:maltose alpha-D-glucosyltransferase/alpha-amylase